MENRNPALLTDGSHIKSSEVALIFILTFLSGLYIYLKVRTRRKNYPPGPVGLPVLGYLPFLGEEPHKTLWDLKGKYGDIIGLYFGTKYTVVLNSWDTVKEILTHPAALDRAPNIFDHIPSVGFISKNGKEWLEQRRFCLSSARDLGVGRGPWETIILDEVQNFIGELEMSAGKPVEISHSLSSSISSNIVSFLFGRSLRQTEEPEKIQLSVDFADVSFTYMGQSNATSVIPWLRNIFELFKIAGYDKAAKVIKGFSKFVKEEVVRHKNSDLHDTNDFICTYLGKLSNLAVSSQTGQHFFSETNLEGNVNILFLAASDTIFSSIGWLLRLMVVHKDVQQKVFNELMAVLGKDGTARYEERHELPYTFAVMMESQRFSSIVPLSTTRCANQDFSVQNCTIPKGAEIVANLWALHNDPKYWEKPEEFRPERFLLNGGTKLVKFPESYAPFSIGRRNCPGETIAWMEILSYFSEIIKNYEITTAPGEKPEFNVVNGLVSHLTPQPLCFKKRSSKV